MVRLKDRATARCSTTTTISIPYGAIKSRERRTDGLPVQLFQFLMVRLKVPSVGLDNLTIDKFQFLMVRLKVSPRLPPPRNISNFNSLWCD